MSEPPEVAEQVTVNLIPKAAKALDRASQVTGDSRTDTINRALQVYAHLVEEPDAVMQASSDQFAARRQRRRQ